MALKIYKVSYPDLYWDCLIKIDEEFVTPIDNPDGSKNTTKDCIKTMVEFWSGSEERLAMNDGDYIKTFLQQLARQILYLSIDYSLQGIISEFKTREGWCNMDGSFGITISSVDAVSIDDSDFILEQQISE